MELLDLPIQGAIDGRRCAGTRWLAQYLRESHQNPKTTEPGDRLRGIVLQSQFTETDRLRKIGGQLYNLSLGKPIDKEPPKQHHAAQEGQGK